MATQTISCTAKHPYPSYEWQYRLSGYDDDGNEHEWDSIENYPPYASGNTTNEISITDPEQGQDEAWIRCIISNPAGGSVTTDGNCYVSVSPLEWTTPLKAETKTVEATVPNQAHYGASEVSAEYGTANVIPSYGAQS